MAEISVKDVGEQAGNVARTVGDVVGKKAEEIADQGRKAGVEAASGLGRAAGKLADSVEEKAPAIADYVRGAGEQVTRLAEDLREKSVGDLLNSAVQFGRAQPLLTIAAAALVGFALARMIKAGAVNGNHSGERRRAA